MGIISDYFEKRAQARQRASNEGTVLTPEGIQTESQFLSAALSDTVITKEKALQIPSVKAALNLIKGVVRQTPIGLYKKDGEKVFEVKDDIRTRLLNNETGDTLNASQMWDAMIEDYFLLGAGYAFINQRGNRYRSLHYVENEEIAVIDNNEPIFKDYDILVRGQRYKPFQFLKIVRDTKDGARGIGIIQENDLLMKVMYNSLKFENNLVATGGNKKGFLKSAKTLADSMIQKLKEAWRKLYSSSNENIVVLNNGLEFQESSNTSVEMQLNENKTSNAVEAAKIFNIPPGMLSGAGTSSSSEDDKAKFVDFCAVPFFAVIENALNRDLLLESEKDSMFFKFDTTELKKGSMLERYQAYKIGIETNVMQVNECRKKENFEPIDYDFLNLGLSSVLYDKKTGKVFVPNTGAQFNLKEMKEGNTDDENSGQE